MYKTLCFFMLSTFFVLSAFSQNYSFKYGKVTNDELKMTSYQKDTTASAVYIYKKSDIGYVYRSQDFVLVSTYESKIKILKPEGTSWANVTIPFYCPVNQRNLKETVCGLEAYAYNLENGKVVKTKLEKKYIFEEQINNKWKQIKFSIPTVKTGSIIEFKYTIESDHYTQIPNIVIQQDIPVIYGNHQVAIPQFFIFNVETRFSDKMISNQTEESISFNVGKSVMAGSMLTASVRKYSFTVEDLQALKEEPFLWCPEDFKTQVEFELSKVEIPGSLYKSFSANWEDIEESLKYEPEFGDVLKMENPYQEEMKSMDLSSSNELEKIRILYKFLKSKISWNNEYRFYGDNVKKAIKTGTGSNADINFVFISMLKDAGIKAYPVMMSRRDLGVLPFTHPSVTKLNTFIVGIGNTDSTMVYLDGSIDKGDINVIPPTLMVDRARVFHEEGKGSWVDLSGIGKHAISLTSLCSVNPEGIIKGKRIISYTGQYANKVRNVYGAEKDSAAYIEKLQADNSITIDSCKYSGLNDFSSTLEEQLSFTKTTTTSNDIIYINPLLFPQFTKNEFIKEERKLPIEFDYPCSYKIRTYISIPDGYKVEELPKSMKIQPDHGGCSCTYSVIQNGNQLAISYSFSMDRIVFSTEEYTTLRLFWTKLVEKNSEMIVLKKIS